MGRYSHKAFNKFIDQYTRNGDITPRVLPEEYCDEEYNAGSVVWVNHLTMMGPSDKYKDIINEVHFRSNT